MRDGKVLSLLRVKIARIVRVERKEKIRARFPFEFVHKMRQHGLRLCRAKASTHEIPLHIDDDNRLFHRNAPPIF